MKKLNRQIVLDYHKFMCAEFDATLVRPTDPMPKFIKHALKNLGVENDFLEKYAITLPGELLGVKTIICIPWEPGVGKTDQYYVQVRRLAHECGHCVQIKHDRPFFATHYLTQPALRANYEALAMHAELELHYWYYGRAALPSTIGKMANGLKAYQCSETDIEITKKHLTKYNQLVASGAVSSEAGKAAIKWLEERT